MTIANRERLPIVHWFAGISIAALANTTAIYSFHNASINGEADACSPGCLQSVLWNFPFSI